jgi:phasin family protein
MRIMTKTPNPFDMDVTKLLGEFKVPGMDVEAVMSSQRKNVEALTKANQLVIEGMQALARRQAEIVRGGIEEAQTLMRDMSQAHGPEERVAKQAEAAKAALEKALSNARELAEIMARSGNEAVDVINRRIGEGLDEVKHLAKKGK